MQRQASISLFKTSTLNEKVKLKAYIKAGNSDGNSTFYFVREEVLKRSGIEGARLASNS